MLREIRLIDPAPELLLAELVRLTEETNAEARFPLARHDADSWRGLLTETAGRPEGARGWEAELDQAEGGERYAILKAIWWTDSQGRRHWLLLGKAKPIASADELDDTPPCPWNHDWCPPPHSLIYPDRAFMRGRASGGDWVVVCDCGAIGSPEAIAWAGDRCGPCHDANEDRLAAGLPAAQVPALMFRQPEGARGGLALSPDGQRLAITRADGLFLRDIATGQEQRLAAGPEASRSGIAAFSADGRQLAWAGPWHPTGTTLRLFDLGRGGCVATADIAGSANTLSFIGRSAAVLCSEGRDRSVVVWDPAAGVEVTRLGSGDRPVLAGGKIARYCEDRFIRVRDVLTGASQDIRQVDEEDGVEGIALSADGRTLAYAITPIEDCCSYWVEVWDLEAGKQAAMWSPGRHTNRHHEFEMAVTADGGHVVTLETNEGTLRFWDARTGREVLVLVPHPGWTAQDNPGPLLFSADGRWLLTENGYGTVRLWPWRELLPR